MRALCIAVLLTCAAVPAWANARITVLMDVLRLGEVIEILGTEGVEYSESLDAEMLDGQGGPFWRAQIDRIYAPEPISERLRAALESGLTPEQVETAIGFFSTDTGARIIDLENAARRALADPEVEEAARQIFAERSAAADPLVGQIGAFIEINDLLERNISGAMSSNVQFYKGLADGGFSDQSEAEILEEVWSQQEDIRLDTEDWLNGYLLMAYQPLPPEAMAAYIRFSGTREGQALNAALFEGFEAFYRDASYALGRAIALSAKADEI